MKHSGDRVQRHIPVHQEGIFPIMRRPLEKVQKGRRSQATPVAKKIFLLTIFVIAQVIFINSDFFQAPLNRDQRHRQSHSQGDSGCCQPPLGGQYNVFER